MYNSDTELLFPTRVIPTLAEMRGQDWQDLIRRVTATPTDPVSETAFVLMMVRMGGCVSCDADSFRAMRGCTQCARQTVRRFRGSDQDLTEQFEQAEKEVRAFLQKTTKIQPDRS